jgi:hypothetical protein
MVRMHALNIIYIYWKMAHQSLVPESYPEYKLAVILYTTELTMY